MSAVQPMTFMQGRENVRVVPIPEAARSTRKGSTMYDEKLQTLMEFKQALQMPEHEFESVRKAATRFLQFRELDKTISVRQKKDHRTKTYLLWFVNTPPAGRTPRE